MSYIKGRGIIGASEGENFKEYIKGIGECGKKKKEEILINSFRKQGREYAADGIPLDKIPEELKENLYFMQAYLEESKMIGIIRKSGPGGNLGRKRSKETGKLERIGKEIYDD